MSRTEPAADQIRLRSSKTGESNLDAYLEAAEKGTRTLADMLGDLFDTDGTFRDELIDFRVNDTTYEIQFRAGTFLDENTGWQSSGLFVFRQQGAWQTGQSYKRLDVISNNNVTYWVTEDHTSGTFSTDLSAGKLEEINTFQIGLPSTDWLTSTSYSIGDSVWNDNKLYRCLVAHTSGTFSSDLSASRWQELLDFKTAVDAAAASASAASTSEINAAASESAASTSETNAATSETNAATSATNAATSETNAAASAAAAATSETNAATSETNAAASATNAATSATNAATSETNAATSATNAATSASAALTSETNAGTSETNAATSETNAATSETNAATSETNAAASASALTYASEAEAIAGTEAAKVMSPLRVAQSIAATEQLEDAIINGDFQINQRGIGFGSEALLPSGVTHYHADRWYTYCLENNGLAVHQFYEDGSDMYRLRHVFKGSTNTAGVHRLSQVISQDDALRFRGREVTLSFKVHVSGSFSGNLGSHLYTGTGVSESALSMESGTWTGLAVAHAESHVTTGFTTATEIERTFTLAGDINEMGVSFHFTDASAAEEWIDIFDVSVRLAGTPKVRPSRASSLARCIPFYQTVLASLRAPSYSAGENFEYGLSWPAMRATPSTSLFGGTNANIYTPTLYSTSTNGARFNIVSVSAAFGDAYSVATTVILDAEL